MRMMHQVHKDLRRARFRILPTRAENNRQTIPGYVAMRAEGQAAVERLLARLGKPFWAVFHVDE